MIIIQSYFVAVLMCVITMLCWDSWANTQKMASYMVRNRQANEHEAI